MEPIIPLGPLHIAIAMKSVAIFKQVSIIITVGLNVSRAHKGVKWHIGHVSSVVSSILKLARAVTICRI